MADTLTEEKLSELAEALAVDKNLPKLGLKLGFKKNKVDMYLGINNRNDSFDGTSNMLFDWKKKTPRINRIPDLKKALIASDLIDFAEDFFPEEGSSVPAQSGHLTPGLLPPTEDFDDMLVTVAKRVHKDSEIDTLGKQLGFTPEDTHRYIATNNKTQNVTYVGTLQMLRDWRNRQTNSTERGALKTALEQSGQMRLADDLFP
ncbi:uncharacterized protein LOC100893424 [Strongylocentrotus purpuratus]|uniref:Death domain-containing protein n=1 Tax=Strongylocentrotus purpuratus TaxID=7668 RepID=A0A7M7GPZ7_STRPU|nr:uncharacterized protein LOC100893424 [Strongylocentrotus purpuratus]|eukprot:XP_003726958.1 PREDICTED: uncharacterized protein LOC100893424 [Strongylocentrotus purpuratus]